MKTEHGRDAKRHPKHSDVEDHRTRLPKKVYEKELRRLQEELAKMEQWVADVGARVVVL